MTTEQFQARVLPAKNKLYRYALSIVSDDELAKDIVQEVFIKLWNQRERLAEIKNIEAWSMTLTRNQSLDKLRSRKMRVVDLTEAKYQVSGHQVSDHQTLNNDLLDKVQSLLDLLPEKQKEIFRLRELLGYSNQEIEEILDMDDNQVKVYLFRARKKIRESLSKLMNYGLEESRAAV